MKFSAKEIQVRKVLAIATLGVAGFVGVTACATAVPAATQSRPPAAPTGNNGVARDIARIAVGNGGLPALDIGDGQASSATCDPSAVSGRSHSSSPVSALCGINYSDGSVWRQTVTVTFDSGGKPVADWTNLGTELLLPTGG
jgi:hypothetical protein